MRRSLQGAALTIALALLPGCGQQAGGDAALDTDDRKASYGIGLNIGRQLQPTEGRLDMDAFQQGVRDAMAGRDPALPQEEIQAALSGFSDRIQTDESARHDEEAAANRAAGEAYLAENGARAGVVTTASGLQYEVLTEGTGARPGPEDRVRIHYQGTLVDGRVFDSSIERGEPASFAVDGVIDGFTEALRLMSVGSKYRVVIPSALAYGPEGARGSDLIGPDATLIFEIELLAIE